MHDPAQRPVLKRLFPAGHGALLERWGDGEWIHERGALARLPELAGLEELSIETFLERHPSIHGDAYGAEGSRLAPLRSWERLDSAALLEQYRRGRTIIFWDLEDAIPATSAVARAIVRELGCLPPDEPIIGDRPRIRGFGGDAVRVALSFTPRDADIGLGAHFDKFDSLALQLRGTKDWHLASDARLQFPLVNESAARSGLPRYMSFRALDGVAAEHFTRVRLTPGAALLNPRGTWHATGGTANSDSATLLFRFQLPSWLDLVMAALRSELSRERSFRQTAFGAFPERDASLSAAALERKLEAAADALRRGRTLVEDGLLARLADRRRARFRLRDPERLRVDSDRVRALYPDGAEGFALPPETARACAWIREAGGLSFALAEFEAAAPELGGAAWSILRYLVDAEILEVRWRSPAAEGEAP